MFIFLVLSFVLTTPQGIAALPVMLYSLQIVLRSLIAFLNAPGHKSLESNGPDIQHDEAPSGSEFSGTRPPYLASSSDDEEVIGGNPIYLSTPVGTKGVTLTFHVFMPPSYEKEIPKVDMYGAMQFVQTGKVRTFVPTGGRRLLVINFQEMTLAVYGPKRGKKKTSNKSQHQKELLFTDYDHPHPDEKRSSGINISTRKLTGMGIENDKVNSDNTEDNEDAWHFRHFDTTPTIHHRLADLVSVAAVPPRHGGVVEIISRLGMIPCKDSIDGSDQFQHSKKEKTPKAMPSPTNKQNVGQGRKLSTKSTGLGSDDFRLNNLEQSAQGDTTATVILPNANTLESGGHINTENSDKKNAPPVMERCDEFTFQTPRHAAEFQRIITALRTAGKEITHLYETLEAIQEPQEIPSETPDETTHTFVSHGVALDDAWHCFSEISLLRKGLYQYHLHTQCREEHIDTFDLDILAQSEKHEDKKEKPILGLVDFFNLFVPPLPINNSHAIPCFTPCAKIESMHDQDSLTRGIEWHYQNLTFVTALLRRVSRAALYVRTYAWARIISKDSHLCKLKPKLLGQQSSDPGSQGADRLSNGDNGEEESGVAAKSDAKERRESNDQHESFDDNNPLQFPNIGTEEVENVGKEGDELALEPPPISDSNLWSPPPVNNHRQGYSCIGWFVIRSPSFRENTGISLVKSSDHPCPYPNPLECIPSLRALVEKYPYAHFLIYSQFTENAVAYFLHVRSLPVGVDRVFDNIVNHLVCSEVMERDKKLGISLIAGPGRSSFLTKASFRVVVTALHHYLKSLMLGLNPTRKREGKLISITEFLTSNLVWVWHFGGLLENKNDLPANYIAINSQFCLKKFPTRIGRGLLMIIKLWVQRATHVNFMFKLRAYSNNVSPERAIASNRMLNVDINDVATLMEVKEPSEITEVSRTHSDATNNKTGSDELNRNNVDVILELLDGIAVPIKREEKKRGEHNQDNHEETVQLLPLQLTRSDIDRYLIACKNDLKATIVRIIESCAWRGMMFPVDTRSCRIEMQSGQFFQQGYDKESNPIFYFRGMLLGPWRKYIYEAFLSVLHRLEMFLVEAERQRSSVKITIIFLMDDAQIEVKKGGDKDEQSTVRTGSDPRIDTHEDYQRHSNILLLQILNEVVHHHYPERIAKILAVPSKSWAKARRRSHVYSPLEHSQVTVLGSRDDLKKYVNTNELVTFAGGKAKVSPDAFSCIGSCDFAGSTAL